LNVDHLAVAQYGRFTLTDAVRPGPGVPIRPRQGYRMLVYRDRIARLRLPMLSAAVSAETLFETFLALLDPLGPEVHAVLESSHSTGADRHTDFRREGIDTPVLASHFYDFEDLLTNDGCTGVAVVAADETAEVQFDEHKLIHIYASDLRPFRQILRGFGVRRRKALPLLCDAEHLHHSTDNYAHEFERLCSRVGVDHFDHFSEV
jgi:hypothetical protein